MHLYLEGPVQKGFGRGGKELGIPTANLPEDQAQLAGEKIESGIYYGYAQMESIYPMVMSFGWNPYYQNEKRSAEVHLLHKFDQDFYGKHLKVVVLGFLRPEKSFGSLQELIDAIHADISNAREQLSRSEYKPETDPFFK
ncbi:riboflavin kinase-like protein [Gorgonomyces haynaldii]|nr:riboflavin kinase-like protein [Gorgonomyces haynaldii]